jgi:hypothetical protein
MEWPVVIFSLLDEVNEDLISHHRYRRAQAQGCQLEKI